MIGGDFNFKLCTLWKKKPRERLGGRSNLVWSRTAIFLHRYIISSLSATAAAMVGRGRLDMAATVTFVGRCNSYMNFL